MTTPTIAWLSSRVLSSLTTEANRAARLETGGVLMGYWAESNREAVIVRDIGPGPSARHGPDYFVPDHDFHVTEIAKLYQASGRRLHYLGDWHTHPGSAAYLSGLDRDTLLKIARAKKARAPRPLMMVLAPGPKWTPRIWCGEIIKRRWLRPELEVHDLDIRVFD